MSLVVRLFHPSACIGEFAIHGMAQPPEDAALHLSLEIDRIEHAADIGSHHALVDLGAAVRRRPFDDLHPRNTNAPPKGHTAALTLPNRPLPTPPFYAPYA